MNIEEFEELINAIPKVESDNPPVSTMNSINVEDLRNAVKRFKKIPSYQELLEENQELKKQLEISETNEETYYLEIKGIAEALELNENSIVEDIYQKILGLKNQQKEFINWLENEIENCKYGEENYADGDDMSYRNENELRIEILSKYKEIIGDKE